MTNNDTRNRYGIDPLLWNALMAIVVQDPDRASHRNGVGAAQCDTTPFHEIAQDGFENLNRGRAIWLYKALRKYSRTQLAGAGIDYAAIEDPAAAQPAPRKERQKKVATISLMGKVLHFTSELGDPAIPMVRALPRRRWIPAPTFAWEVPLIIENIDGLRAMYKSGGVTFTPEALNALRNLTGGGPNGKGGSNAPTTTLRDLATAKQGTLEVKGLGMQLFPFQQAGVEYMTRTKRCINADEMGLGKTAEALASLQHTGAFPALIVVPATLKLNWQNEAARWLPGRTVTVLNGTKPEAFLHGDIVIINYDVLYAWAEVLSLIPWKALVCDEAHYCKDKKARRSQAVKAIIKATAPQYRFFLTGTPLVNRPIEATNLLDLLGYLRPVFGGFMTFAKRYCDATQGRFGWDFTHANMALLPELNERLRATCMVRRLKMDVLTELPAKQRADVPVDLDPRIMAEYYRAQNDVIEWLQETAGNARAERAMRAEAIVRINTLRKLIAQAKLKSIVAWAANFTGYDKKTGTWDEDAPKLVIFAHHISLQDALQKAFPEAAYIRGDQSKASVEEHKARFQNESSCKMIICSLKAGGFGHTLTAASNVALCEADWSPHTMVQAEDRTHRIGQRDAVTAYYLLAEGTVDGEMARLLHSKQRVIDAAVDGKMPAEDDDEAIVDGVIAWLRTQPVRR
jgi:SNF2 family DNA or RNA helicase